MPLHDWTKVNSGLYHHFQQCWTMEICSALNRRGRMPKNLSALVEQRSGFKEPDVVAVELASPDEPGGDGGSVAVLERPRTRITRQADDAHYAGKANRIVIRHRLGRVVAFIEIVSPGNKDGVPALRQFVEKVAEALRQGIHVLVIDPFPPTPRDPWGIHKAIWDCIHVEEFDLPADQNRVLASYEGDGVFSAFIETVGLATRSPKCRSSSRPAPTSWCRSKARTWRRGRTRRTRCNGSFWRSRRPQPGACQRCGFGERV